MNNDSVTLVGMGSVGMDFLASVASFPKPDDKMRTEELETEGGGNCGNALTAAARLLSGASTSGSTVRVVSKIGTDAAGDAILKEFVADNIDTSNVLVTSDKSPFTYIIVDRETNTRTCIHTPGEPYLEEEMTPAQIEKILDGASAVRACIIRRRGRRRGESDDDAGGEGVTRPSTHPSSRQTDLTTIVPSSLLPLPLSLPLPFPVPQVYFDGRLAEPALLLARAARAKGIKVLVEAERYVLRRLRRCERSGLHGDR